MTNKMTIRGRDFNCSLDKDTHSLPFRTFIQKYDFVDVLGKMYGKQVGYTWENSRGMKSRLNYILIGTKG